MAHQPRWFDARACTDTALEPVGPADNVASGLVSRMLHEMAQFRVELHRSNARRRVLLLLELLGKIHPPETDSFWLPGRQDMADLLDINHITASRVVAGLYREGVLQRTARHGLAGIAWDNVTRLLAS